MRNNKRSGKEEKKMKKVQKHDRISVITNILTDNPNKIYTLTYFCNLYFTVLALTAP